MSRTMSRRLQLAMLLLLPAALAVVQAIALAETLDRVVVVVDKGVILASQWDQAVRYEALAEGKDVRRLTAADRERTLDRLIDQSLLEQQIATTTYKRASAEEIAAKVLD